MLTVRGYDCWFTVVVLSAGPVVDFLSDDVVSIWCIVRLYLTEM
jgi:hypothetical protein